MLSSGADNWREVEALTEQTLDMPSPYKISFAWHMHVCACACTNTCFGFKDLVTVSLQKPPLSTWVLSHFSVDWNAIWHVATKETNPNRPKWTLTPHQDPLPTEKLPWPRGAWKRAFAQVWPLTAPCHSVPGWRRGGHGTRSTQPRGPQPPETFRRNSFREKMITGSLRV